MVVVGKDGESLEVKGEEEEMCEVRFTAEERWEVTGEDSKLKDVVMGILDKLMGQNMITPIIPNIL
jgi:hypothetical protein